MNSLVRVLIAEVRPIVLHGLAAIIEQRADFRVAGRAEEVSACLRQIDEAAPDIALVAVSLPETSGWEVLTRVVAKQFPTKVILLGSGKRDEEILALNLGATAYLSSNADAAMIHNCLNDVREGRKWFSSPGLHARRVSRAHGLRAWPGSLTSREREVAGLAAHGLSNKAIARHLTLSDGTVRIHLQNIFKKLGVANRTQLAARAYGVIIRGPENGERETSEDVGARSGRLRNAI